jgi:hypothetical protein
MLDGQRRRYHALEMKQESLRVLAHTVAGEDRESLE